MPTNDDWEEEQRRRFAVDGGTRLKTPVKAVLLTVGAGFMMAFGYLLPHDNERIVEKVIQAPPVIKEVIKEVAHCPNGPIKTQRIGALTFYFDTESGCKWVFDAKDNGYTAVQPEGKSCRFNP